MTHFDNLRGFIMKLTIKLAVEMITELQNRIETLESAQIASKPARDRGPMSTRKMTVDDARRLILGDMTELSHKVAADTLGLSYAQVYSARCGYTFKDLQEELIAAKKQ